MKRILLSLTLPLCLAGYAQTSQPWQGKKAAVVLTYDDALAEHLDNAIPVLDSLGLKATFYLSAYYPASRQRMADWRKAAANGHELANHTLFHPCVGGKGREWVNPNYDLRTYTVQRMVDEIRMTNVFLESLDGKKKRTFAFPCADTKIHDTAYYDGLKNDFIAARNVRAQMHTIDKVDLNDVDCYMVNGETAEQMIEWVKKAEQTNSLLVILFHGVGGGNSLNVLLPEHRRFLEYLQKNQKDLWVAPMLEVAEYIKKQQQH